MPNLLQRSAATTEEYRAIVYGYALKAESATTGCGKGDPSEEYVRLRRTPAIRGGSDGDMNHKVLSPSDHCKNVLKDSFYIYVAWWSDEPFAFHCSGAMPTPQNRSEIRSTEPEECSARHWREALGEQESSTLQVPGAVSWTAKRRVQAVAGAASTMQSPWITPQTPPSWADQIQSANWVWLTPFSIRTHPKKRSLGREEPAGKEEQGNYSSPRRIEVDLKSA